MRYFFHICDGHNVYPDEVGSCLAGREAAIAQARFIADELAKAGEFHRAHRVVVVDQDGQHVFECRAP
jgi:hypothetical protein